MFFAISDLLAPNLLAACYLPFPKNNWLCADLCYNLKDGEIFRPQHFKTHFFLLKRSQNVNQFYLPLPVLLSLLHHSFCLFFKAFFIMCFCMSVRTFLPALSHPSNVLNLSPLTCQSHWQIFYLSWLWHILSFLFFTPHFFLCCHTSAEPQH